MITAMCFKASMKKKECLIIAHVLIVETEAADRCRHPPISSSFLSSIPYSLFRVLLLFYLLTHLFRSSLPSLCFFSGCLYFFFFYIPICSGVYAIVSVVHINSVMSEYAADACYGYVSENPASLQSMIRLERNQSMQSIFLFLPPLLELRKS